MTGFHLRRKCSNRPAAVLATVRPPFPHRRSATSHARAHSLSLSDTQDGTSFPVMDLRTAQALIRFGLGRRGEEPLPADPAVWLNDQLRQPDPARIDPPPSTATGLEALRFDRETKPPRRPARRAAPCSRPNPAPNWKTP